MCEKVNLVEAIVCPGCRHPRSLGDFPHPDCRGVEPWAVFCKFCWKRAKEKRTWIRRKKLGDIFGVPRKFGLFEYFTLLTAQDCRCAICQFWPDFPLSELCIDHCHANGHVRGLLCTRCNTGIGQFGNDPARLRAAAAYLEVAAARLERAQSTAELC
jgi:hypothetical protein